MPSTSTTTTEKDVKKEETKEKDNAGNPSDGMDENRKKSLTAEMRGFLDIITKFTDIKSLPQDIEIDQWTFAVRTVS